MAKDKEEKNEGGPSDQFIVTIKGYHGKILRVGQQLSRGQLVALGGFVPDYCKPVGTLAARQAVDDSEADTDGFKNNDERARFLAAKGVVTTAKVGKAKLQAMIREAVSKESAAPVGNPLGI